MDVQEYRIDTAELQNTLEQNQIPKYPQILLLLLLTTSLVSLQYLKSFRNFGVQCLRTLQEM
jgi:hypothetical protein